MKTEAILTDIEGTTSAISFVHEVLFPYAAQQLADFIQANSESPDIAAILDDVREEADAYHASTNQLVEIMLRWIDEDRKVTPLKALQGHIWRHGYERGDFTGHVYPDAVDGLRRWFQLGIGLFVYSSGSVAAQRYLFGYSDAGDLRPLFSGYFDTRIGPKKAVESYRAIAESIALPAEAVLFLSDVAEELDAAANAGMQTTQLVRDDEIVVGSHPVAANFDDVIIAGYSKKDYSP